jgi:hypothetical protein
MLFGVLRAYALGLGLLAIATALFLDGVIVRFVLQPILRRFEAQSGGRVTLPPGMRFMLEHAWARRAYNATFGLILVGIWWYLGTPSGARLLH